MTLAADIRKGAANVVDVNDKDDDTILAFMERSDRGLSRIKGYGSSFKLIFVGTEKPGRYEAEVLFSDQITYVVQSLTPNLIFISCTWVRWVSTDTVHQEERFLRVTLM